MITEDREKYIEKRLTEIQELPLSKRSQARLQLIDELEGC